MTGNVIDTFIYLLHHLSIKNLFEVKLRQVTVSVLYSKIRRVNHVFWGDYFVLSIV